MRKTVLLASALTVSVLLTLAPGQSHAQTAAPSAAGSAIEAPLDVGAVVAGVRRVLATRYVLPERRPALDAVLADGLASGRYAVSDPAELADLINADLERVGQDKHLDLNFDPAWAARVVAAQAADAAEAARSGGQEVPEPDRSAEVEEARAANHGVKELRVLPGNVRYMLFDGFHWVESHTPAVLDNAMRFLAEGDAIIIDLRDNGGGSGDASHYLISQFLPPNHPVYTFYDEGRPGQLITTGAVASAPILGKPIYLLTSGETGSAAEAFTGALAGDRVAEVVGENTHGAGYGADTEVIAGGFVFIVSTGRVVLASTGRDWERVGVAPTIPTSPPLALDVAHAHALRRLATSAPADQRVGLEAMAEGISARVEPRAPARPLSVYVGDFGERTVRLDDGALYYQNGQQPRRLLVPLGGDLFAFGNDPVFRVRFIQSGEEVVAMEVAMAGNPPQGRYERTP